MQLDVLVIDDNQVNLTLFSSLVRRIETCTPVAFATPAAALEWCASHRPDLVLVDYMMPGMDGLECLRRLRGLFGDDPVPVLMITAVDQSDVRYRALAAGANDYLTKPIDPVEFSARVRNMLALQRQQRQLSDRAEWLAAAVREATLALSLREQDTIFRLARAAEFRDPETGMHLLRMAAYSQHIASRLGLDEAAQELILKAAPMHDVGKVGTPDHILLKPGKLSVEEFEVMKQHAAMGYEILKGSDSPLMQAAAEIALTHHEKVDGSGYPNGLLGDDIPLMGRIVAVADVFDALTSARPYKPAWELDRACDLLREGAGRHFDPRCLEAFFLDWDEVLVIKSRLAEAHEA